MFWVLVVIAVELAIVISCLVQLLAHQMLHTKQIISAVGDVGKLP